MANTETLKDRLRSVGMRITAPRLAVLDAVHRGGHRSADAIAVVAREHLGVLSQQAVYDNLHALLEAGLVRRIEPANAPALYEARVGDNHHHLVCTDCGRVEDVDCAVGHRPCLEPNETHGFRIIEAEVVYWGQCPDCQANEAPATEGNSNDLSPSHPDIRGPGVLSDGSSREPESIAP